MVRRPYDQSDVPLLLKLYASYTLWCIGALPERDRVELERMTPILRREYPHPGEWYEIVEAEWDLLPRGRAMIREAYQEMSSEMTAEEFTVEWVDTVARKIVKLNKRQQEHARRKAAIRDRGRKSPARRR